jgi:hypothetical protein
MLIHIIILRPLKSTPPLHKKMKRKGGVEKDAEII